MRWLRNLRTILFFAALGNPFSFVLFMLMIAAIFGSAPLNVRAAWSTFGAFIAFAGLATAGLVLAPLMAVPRALLAKYETRKVRLATHRIDAGVRERAAGALSHPVEDDHGNISLTV